MKSILTDRGKIETVEELDVSILTKYLNSLIGIPAEIKILEYYNLRSKGDNNTVSLFKEFLKNKLGVTTDVELYSRVKRIKFTKTVLKIKTIIDSLVYREFGCEVLDASFNSYITATKETIIIKLNIIK